MTAEPRDLPTADALHDQDAERAVLGAMLIDPAAWRQGLDMLEVADFTDPRHRQLFSWLPGLAESMEPGERLDLVTLKCALAAHGDLLAVGGQSYLIQLADSVPGPGNLREYAQIVRKKALRRAAIDEAEGLGRALASPDADPGRLVRGALGRLQLLGERMAGVGRPPLAAVRLSDVEPDELAWLWPCRIPRGRLTVLAGDPGVGKSFLSLDIAARVTRGDGWPDGSPGDGTPGTVVLLQAEDGLADTVRPRLDALGADPSRVVAIRGVVTAPDGLPRQVDLSRDVAALRQTLDGEPDVRLVVIDPLSAYLGDTDSHKDAAVRGVLAPLAALAEAHGAAVLALMHLNKRAGASALHRAMGSVGFTAAARAGWVVVPDRQDADRRVLAVLKMNLAPKVKGLAFRLVDGVVRWEDGPVEADADALLAPVEGSTAPALDEAKSWLRAQLADGPVLVKDLQAKAEADGVAWGTVRRAKVALHVEARKMGFGRGSWRWAMPDERRATKGEGAQAQGVSANAEDAHLCGTPKGEAANVLI